MEPNPTDKIQATPSGNSTEVLDTLAKNRSVIPIAFALVIVLFFFGFCDFKCNSMKVASLTGINLVTGTHVKMNAGGMLNDNLFDSMNGNSMNKADDKNQKVEPNIWAILAFLAAIGGLIAFYKKIKMESLAGTAAGAIGFISLLLLRIAIKNKIGEQGGGMVQVEIDFLFAYWVSMLAFLTGGGISYLRMKKEKNEQLSPPQDTPHHTTPIHVNIITQDNNTKPEK